ncbi:tetratricopeptide repeat protein [Paludisphaera sp.]|uniref:tetratricopeptide repeat protein n=1 Tax=Paludisphaera sp. TaxID=2017432 RepID=UPI00301C48B2
MPILIPIALIGWIPVCLVLFAFLPRRQAVLVGVVGAWLFLPPGGVSLAGLPDYTKTSAFGYGIMLATLIFTPDRIARLRPGWVDLPMACFIGGVFASSVRNGLGVYDGLSSVNMNLTLWGIPYLIGRLHFENARDIRAAAIAVVVGGLVYVPICLPESVLGAFVASKIYGLNLYSDVRLGGYRPRGFFYRGLELGFWMSGSSLLGLWLARCRAVPWLAGLPFTTLLLPILVISTLLCRSSGALALLAMGLAVLWLSTRLKTRLIMLLWISLGILYPTVRVVDAWEYEGLIAFLSENFDDDRSRSLAFRLANEDLLMEKALLRPVFGWGGWGRARVYDVGGRDLTVTDGYWVIVMGSNGVVGLLSLTLAFVGPAFAFVARYPPRRWTEPDIGAMAAVSTLLGMYLMDCLMNAFPNALYMALAGALASATMDRARIPSGAWGIGGDEGVATPDEAGDDPTASTPEGRLAGRYVELAQASRLAGDYASAAEARRHAYDLLAVMAERGPEPPAARRRRLDCGNDLAWLLATRPDPEPGDLEEGAELARAAAEAEPGDPAYWNTLALALCRLGDDEAALAAARRSMELDAAWNGYDMAVLALALARTGRREEAARWLAEASSWRDERRSREPSLNALIAEAAALVAP